MFDLNSQSGVMSVLASIRASALSPAEKNELRDLVFLYTNGGGDVSVRIELEQKLTSHNIAPVAAKRAGANSSNLPFGSSRPTPVFKAPVVADNVVPAAGSTPQAVATTPPISTPSTMPVVPPMPAPTVVLTPPAPVYPPTSQPVVPPSAPAIASPVPPPLMTSPAPVSNSSPHLERIRQIKAAVNSKVGNPVNLVDIDNAVGREYMNALLEAMKKLSSGAESEMPAAMDRLEKAFSAVEAAIAARNEGATISPNNVTPKPEPLPEVKVPLGEPVVPPPLPLSKATFNNPPQVPPPPPPPLPPAAPVDDSPFLAQRSEAQVPEPVKPTFKLGQMPLPPAQTEKPGSDLSQFQPVVLPGGSGPDQMSGYSPKAALFNDVSNVDGDQPAYIPPRMVGPATPIKKVDTLKVKSDVVEPPPLSALPPTPVVAPIPVPAAAKEPVPQKPLGSLADLKNVKTPNDLPDAASLNTGGSNDPLFTKEVDDGLDQLLSDWVLFKKSGLFGRGPKGREHPLFKKVAALPIPLLLAGRFEGATQEIRQSITDYMNGWRYEQGIIYEQGETFERYLRRVIRHIIDLQKKRK